VQASRLHYGPIQEEPMQVNSTLSATGAVTLTLGGNPGFPDNLAVVEVSGTFTGVTAAIQGSADGTNWTNLAAVRADTLALETAPTVTDATARTWLVNVAGLQKVRFNVTALGTNSITVQINSAFFPVSPLPAVLTIGQGAGGTPQPVTPQPPGAANTGQTGVTASSTGGAQANNCTLAAVAGKTNYVTGFEVTGAGATAAGVISITLTGIISGTLNYSLAIPAGANAGVPPLVVQFTEPIPASAVNTALTLNVPSFGAGNTNASAALHGFYQ
jgi:hypothetical protein